MVNGVPPRRQRRFTRCTQRRRRRRACGRKARERGSPERVGAAVRCAYVVRFVPSRRGCVASRSTGLFTVCCQAVIVVGAGNTSIDICQDLCFHKAKSVVMVQRSVSAVTDTETIKKTINALYADDAPTEIGDLRFTTIPIGLFRKMRQDGVQQAWKEDAAMFDKLRKGGLNLYMGPDNAGIPLLVFERGGGESLLLRRD